MTINRHLCEERDRVSSVVVVRVAAVAAAAVVVVVEWAHLSGIAIDENGILALAMQ